MPHEETLTIPGNFIQQNEPRQFYSLVGGATEHAGDRAIVGRMSEYRHAPQLLAFV